MIYESITGTIGKTPLVRLNRIEKSYGLKCRLYAKIEFFNPGGSIKDRTAMKMLRDAYEKGIIEKGSVIVEPTSGNTGIGLALSSLEYDLKVIITMPESASRERVSLMNALGADVRLTPAEKGMRGAIDLAEKILAETENSFMPMQFNNPSNPDAHYSSTAPEICEDLGRAPDHFVAGVGTGGTLTGCARYFRDIGAETRITAVEPMESPVISGGGPSSHGIQGIGAGFIPEILDLELIDNVAGVKTEEAFEFTRICAKEEKILCGISSGAVLAAAVKTARGAGEGTVVSIFPDTGERYLSSGLFD
jgi:cysteine synthase A